MPDQTTKEHFDEIASGYNEEISGHVRDHLINKFWNIVSGYIAPGTRLLDVGCGDGTNVVFFKDKGVEAVGVDFSRNLLGAGIARNESLRGLLSNADACTLPFHDSSFDNVTMIGVLHHIHSDEGKKAAVTEALRVVRPGGHVVIRECNLINPLFRIFWNYIFPLTAKIDRFGGESWITAGKISRTFQDRLVDIRFFTFLPNFTPRFVLPAAVKVEDLLEKSPLRKLSAHYIAVLRRGGDGI